MKTESKAKATCVWRDQNYEALTREQLQAAQVSLQSVLDVWSSLELTKCKDIYALIANPQKVYSDAVSTLAEVPKQTGRFPISKAAYIQTLEVPLPDLLYRAAKAARQTPYALSAELWQIVDGTVQLVDMEAELLLSSQSIFATSPDRVRLINDLEAACKQMNSCNERLDGELLPGVPWTFAWCRGHFLLEQKDTNSKFELRVDPAYLRRIVQG